MRKKAVVIGGGTGTFVVLQALKQSGAFDLTAIVSMADNGGSTGQLRDELGVLPPGDLRQALVALADDSPSLRDLFTYRFEEGSLKGHAVGNILLAGLEKLTGSMDKAVLEAADILKIDGRVLPVANDPITLYAEAVDGTVITGEHAIEEFVWSDQAALERLWVEPPVKVHPLAAKAIREADLIVVGPGSLFTSLIPCLLVDGVVQALEQSKAELVYVCNLMAEKGQTTNWSVQDYAALIQRYLGKRNLNAVVYNTAQASTALLERYRKEMERTPVRRDTKRPKQPYRLVGAKLLAGNGTRTTSDPLAAQRTLIRHDKRKLGRVLVALAHLKDVERWL